MSEEQFKISGDYPVELMRNGQVVVATCYSSRTSHSLSGTFPSASAGEVTLRYSHDEGSVPLEPDELKWLKGRFVNTLKGECCSVDSFHNNRHSYVPEGIAASQQWYNEMLIIAGLVAEANIITESPQVPLPA